MPDDYADIRYIIVNMDDIFKQIIKYIMIKDDLEKNLEKKLEEKKKRKGERLDLKIFLGDLQTESS